jgi:hypothetical protein
LVADHGLDGGSSSEFEFDSAEHAALLSQDEDSSWILRGHGRLKPPTPMGAADNADFRGPAVGLQAQQFLEVTVLPLASSF